MTFRLCLPLVFALSVPAADVSQSERQRLVRYLLETSGRLEAETRGLSAAQLGFRPAADQWSIADCIEHIALAEQTVHRIAKDVAASPAPAARRSREEDQEGDQAIMKIVRDRATKRRAPEALSPSGKSAAEMLALFKHERDAMLDLAETGPRLRGAVRNSPIRKDLDLYQWLTFAAGHAERHIAQIAEIKAAPGYPSR